jgi:hypothetical protein
MKKLLITSMIIFSATSFARDNTISALLKVIPVGTYQGVTDEDSHCSVNVQVINGFYKSFVLVTSKDNNSTTILNIDNENDYGAGRIGKQNVLFLQNVKHAVSTDEMEYRLDSIKVIPLDNFGLINVSTGNYEYQNRDSQKAEVSCSIRVK